MLSEPHVVFPLAASLLKEVRRRGSPLQSRSGYLRGAVSDTWAIERAYRGTGDFTNAPPAAVVSAIGSDHSCGFPFKSTQG